ncbi:helix-turn-helix domain-containing protein [Burkholderia orbicola]|uniref:helix-turn-helix domain-containing protein n=1 Tax=Burkholderia cenocepacia TaxID=95486 RepID=UPI0020137334|nr:MULTISPECIES: helix-turn-helix domain-containing protein [Burkholderia cepacia complex]MDN7468635.1 helix-turn-helix domain-containing protein [Burkholderia orbicola]MDN7501290.1 helix-turn-helix domain-containing protein [Burkholderia orbicola]
MGAHRACAARPGDEGASRRCARRRCRRVQRHVGRRPAGPQASLHEQSLDAIRRALDEHDGNVSAAARQLGISRTTLYAKLRQLDAAGIRHDGPH